MLGFYNTNYRKKSCFKSSWLLAMSRRQDAQDEYLGRQVILGTEGLNKCCLISQFLISYPFWKRWLKLVVAAHGSRKWLWAKGKAGGSS